MRRGSVPEWVDSVNRKEESVTIYSPSRFDVLSLRRNSCDDDDDVVFIWRRMAFRHMYDGGLPVVCCLGFRGELLC